MAKDKVERTLDNIGRVVEKIVGTVKDEPLASAPITNQSNLERFGMAARKEHLFRNEWQKNLQYTKTLVESEYMIQSEFKISSYGETLDEAAENAEKKQQRKEDKKRRKEEKKQQKEEKKKAKQKV